MSTITYKDIMDVFAKFKEEHPVNDRIDFIIKSSSYMLPTDSTWLMEHEGKKYLAIHEILWQALLKQCIVEKKNDYNYSYFNSFVGIPVIEDDELLRKILLGMAEKWLDQENKKSEMNKIFFRNPVRFNNNYFDNLTS